MTARDAARAALGAIATEALPSAHQPPGLSDEATKAALAAASEAPSTLAVRASLAVLAADASALSCEMPDGLPASQRMAVARLVAASRHELGRAVTAAGLVDPRGPGERRAPRADSPTDREARELLREALREALGVVGPRVPDAVILRARCVIEGAL